MMSDGACKQRFVAPSSGLLRRGAQCDLAKLKVQPFAVLKTHPMCNENLQAARTSNYIIKAHANTHKVLAPMLCLRPLPLNLVDQGSKCNLLQSPNQARAPQDWLPSSCSSAANLANGGAWP